MTPGIGTNIPVINPHTEAYSDPSAKLNETYLRAIYNLSQIEFGSEKELITFAVEEAVRVTNSQFGYLHFINPDQQVIELYIWSRETYKTCTSAIDRHQPLQSAGVWADAVRLKQPVVHNDYPNMPDKKGYPPGHNPITRHMSVPVLEDERVVQVIGVANKEEAYDEQDVSQLQAFVGELWKLISHIRTVTAFRQRIVELEAVNKISTTLRSANTLDELLPLVLDEILKTVDSDTGAIVLHDPMAHVSRFVETRNWFKLIADIAIPETEGVFGHVFTTGQPYISTELASDTLTYPTARPSIPPGWRAVCVPIRSPQIIVGALYIATPISRIITFSDVHFLTTIAEIAGIAIQRMRLNASLQNANLVTQKEISQRIEIQALLEKEKELFSVTLLSIGEGVIATDLNGIVTLMNQAAKIITGFSQQESIGKPVNNILQLLDEKTDLPVSDLINHLLKLSEMEKVDPQYHHPSILTKSGDRLLLAGDISPLKGHGAQVLGYVLIFRNITEKQIIEEQSALSQKMESIGQLAAGISHEINTPIQYVGDNINYFERAFARYQDMMDVYQKFIETHQNNIISTQDVTNLQSQLEQHKIKHYAGEIPAAIQEAMDGVERVRKIVLAIREFSHPAEKEKKLADINQGILTTITISRNEWKYYADLETELDPQLPQVCCQIDEINQVVLIMIVNAAQAIQETLPANTDTKGKITINTYSRCDYVYISIQDTGGGIPETIRNRIFDPFFTTKGVGKGTGQGLSISHNIVVKNHKGHIYVESEVGKGTRFTIELPIEAEKES